MKRFLDLPINERRELITEAAARRGISAVIFEKDFWVCLVLEKLFQSDSGDHLTFKGGTSLSKAHGLISRFSEDIDLTLDKDFINRFGNATSLAPSKITKQAKKVIKEHLLPALQAALKDYGRCSLSPDDDQTILFEYESVISEGLAYIPKRIKIEFGARGEIEPNIQKMVTPYLAETLPEAFDGNIPQISVTALTAERTFWEKATILHSIAHQPKERGLQERMSRHYHDLLILAQNAELLKNALNDAALLAKVVAHKQEYFKEQWNWYDSAERGTLKILPPPHLIKTAEKDYDKMKVMLFDQEPMSFAELLEGLKALERQINASADNN